jgi:S-adenosylmethionine:tRNA-ribosyltransferase-isomerase (queuine synthetase)
MKLSELEYELPAEQIAQRPLEPRDASRMLVLERETGAWGDRQFRELPDILRGDELVVINNARVLPARLVGRRAGICSGKPGAGRRAASSCRRQSKCCWCASSAPKRGRGW